MIQKLIKVSVLILTYNRCDVLKELLNSLYEITYSPLEIIVVDNHSTDKTEKLVKEYPEINYYRTTENIGVGARNIGLSNASGDIIITLDDDIIGIDDNDIEALITFFDSKLTVGAVCFKVKDYYSGNVCNWCHHYMKGEFCDREFVTDEITEGAVAFRKSALEKSGLYPSFFFISYEGVDLLCRLLNNGYKTIYFPDVCVWHRTHQSGRANWRRYYYDTRNQIWFVVRNLPFLFGLKYLLRGLSALLIYSVRDGFFYYWLKGIYHGFRNVHKIMRNRERLGRVPMQTLKMIASNRPSLTYTLRQRLFKRDISL